MSAYVWWSRALLYNVVRTSVWYEDKMRCWNSMFGSPFTIHSSFFCISLSGGLFSFQWEWAITLNICGNWTRTRMSVLIHIYTRVCTDEQKKYPSKRGTIYLSNEECPYSRFSNRMIWWLYRHQNFSLNR